MNIEKRIERDLRLFDLFFVPSSLVRKKFEYKKKKGTKISNLGYIPIIIGEVGRIYLYYELLKNY